MSEGGEMGGSVGEGERWGAVWVKGERRGQCG